MPNWKKIIVSGSDASLSSAYIDGNLTASAAFLTSASIGHLETIYETASVIYSSGSTKFGDTSDDTHEITGSLLVSGNAQFVDILGVANEIVMVGSNNSLTSSTILSLDPANNYLGINQPNPEVTLHMTGDGAQTAQIRMEQYNDSADAPDIRTRKARGTSALPTAPNAGDYLFRQNVERYNGSGYSTMHSQQFDLADDDATKAVYQLQTDIGSGLANRMVIDKEGNILFTSAVTASFFTGSFTGSLEGSASYAVTASHVAGGLTNSGSFSGSFEGDGSGLTGISVTQAATITDTFTAETSVTVSHNFVTENVLVTAYTDNGEQLIPQTVRTLDENNVGVDFATSTTGRIVVAKGGHIVSGSVLTASLAMELSNLATASIANTATTASHTAGTASFANLATTSSISDLASTLSNTATASFADTATTASHVVTASFADNATSASFAVTASYALNAAAGGGGVGYSNNITLSTDYTATANTYNSLYGPLYLSTSIDFEIEEGAFVKIEEF
jgi:hypothetical protein